MAQEASSIKTGSYTGSISYQTDKTSYSRDKRKDTTIQEDAKMKIRKQLTPDSWRTTKKHDKMILAMIHRTGFSEPMSVEESSELVGQWEAYWREQDRLLDEIERILDEPENEDGN